MGSTTITNGSLLGTAHPLAVKYPHHIGTWDEWKKRWDQAETVTELRGLLFDGLKPPSMSEEAICFYLDVADGYRQSANFTWNTGEFSGDAYVPDRRQEVAIKAWKILCNDFFDKKDIRMENRPVWHYYIQYDTVLQKLLWFFNPNRQDNIPARFDSFSKRHVETTRKFLERMIRFAWHFGRPDLSADSPVREMFREHRPQFIEILAELHRLDLMLEWGDVDDADLAKLEEIALRTERYNRLKSEVEIVKTIEEAYQQNSRAAKVLILLRVKKQEARREERREELERQKIETERELKKLQAKPTS